MKREDIKALSPSEIKIQHSVLILPEVIQAVNELLVKEFDGKYDVTLLQKDIIERTLQLCEMNNVEMTRSRLFSEKHMNFEAAFRKVGWEVVYDGPAYCETYEATFKFTPKKR